MQPASVVKTPATLRRLLSTDILDALQRQLSEAAMVSLANELDAAVTPAQRERPAGDAETDAVENPFTGSTATMVEANASEAMQSLRGQLADASAALHEAEAVAATKDAEMASVKEAARLLEEQLARATASDTVTPEALGKALLYRGGRQLPCGSGGQPN